MFCFVCGRGEVDFRQGPPDVDCYVTEAPFGRPFPLPLSPPAGTPPPGGGRRSRVDSRPGYLWTLSLSLL